MARHLRLEYEGLADGSGVTNLLTLAEKRMSKRRKLKRLCGN